MKKKKIFLGLAIASAALFSLAACNSTSQSGSTSTPAASTSVPAASSTPVAADYTATFVAVVDGERDSALISKTATSSNGKFARPADADMAKEGYLFQGFYSNATVTTEFNFNNAVSANTTIYCKYHKMTQFDTLKADTDHLVFAEDFNSTTVSKSVVDKLSCKATTPTVYVESETDPEFDGSQFNMGDAGKGILFDFGGAKSGVIKAYFEVSFQQTQGEAFAQFVGTDPSANKTDDEVFALRTSSKKFFYRFDGGTDVALSTNNAVAVNQKYAFFIELDTSEGKISITQDGVKVVDNAATTITEVKGLKFTCKNSADKHSKKSIDNVAVTSEAKGVSPVVTAKETALGAITTYLSAEAYTSLDANSPKKALIDAQVAESRKAINAAETVEAVSTAKSAWDTFAAKKVLLVTVKAYSAASTAVTTLTDAQFAVLEGESYAAKLPALYFNGYVVESVFTDATLETACTGAALTADATIYAKVREGVKETVSYTAAATSLENEWASNGAFKEEAADGKEGESGHEPTGTYAAVQFTLKKADEKDEYIKTPTLTGCKNSAVVKMTGWTAGSADAKDYVIIKAYDAQGNEIGSKVAYTPKNKQKGDFSADAAGTEKDIVIVASADIAYLKISCQTDTKSFFVTTIAVEYLK